MKLSIITPASILYSADARMVTLPGSEGEFGVLPGHSPLIATLKSGIVTVETGEGRVRFAILSGVAEVTQDHCSVLAERALPLEGISPQDAQVQLQAARDEYESAHTEELKTKAKEQLVLAEHIAAAA